MNEPHDTDAPEPAGGEIDASPPQPMPVPRSASRAEHVAEYHEDDSFDEVLPPRPRARFLTPLTALLMALILGGVGFYVGIRVEKANAGTGTGSAASPFARAFSAFSGTTSTTGGAATGGRSGFSGAGSFASRFGGAFGGAGGTVGTIASIDGRTIYVNEVDGNTVKVKLSGVTKITKSERAPRSKLYPGDEVTVLGSAAKNGTVSATSVSDSGAASTGTSTSSSSSSSNSSSAISSLFGGG